MAIIGLIIGVFLGIKFSTTKYLRFVGAIAYILAIVFNNTILAMFPWDWLIGFYDCLSGAFGIFYLIGLIISVADNFDNRMSSRQRTNAHIITTIIRSLFH